MKTPRLDWMKFNIYDFVHSEDIEAMTAEEVGQYILLLAAAWVGGKDCTLPNDPAYLGRKARGTVSSKVMAKFMLTSDGRLVNEVQREIWVEQIGNFQAASEAGKRGRAKQLDRDLPDALRTTPGQTPGDKNGMDWNGNEKNRKDSNANGIVQPAEQDNESFLSPNSNHNGNGQSHSQPKPQSKPSPVSVTDDLEFDTLPQSQKLARVLYDSFPQETKDAAPAAWERLWADDFAKLEGENFRLVCSVIDFVQTSARWKKLIVRGKVFVEKYHEINEDRKKLNVKRAQKGLPPVGAMMTNKERAASGFQDDPELDGIIAAMNEEKM